VTSVSTVVAVARPEELREVAMLESLSFLGRDEGAITLETGDGERGKSEGSLYDFMGVGAGPATTTSAGPHFTNCVMPSHIDILC